MFVLRLNRKINAGKFPDISLIKKNLTKHISNKVIDF